MTQRPNQNVISALKESTTHKNKRVRKAAETALLKIKAVPPADYLELHFPLHVALGDERDEIPITDQELEKFFLHGAGSYHFFPLFSDDDVAQIFDLEVMATQSRAKG